MKILKRKTLAALLALSLLASLLPLGAQPAQAAAPGGQVIYVGNVNVTRGGYWTTDSDGNVNASTAGGTPADNYIHYDAGDNTLTLHNATIKNGLDYSEGIQGGTYIPGSAIGVLNLNGDAELTITLAGTNTIEDVSTGIFVLAHSSYTGDASLTITGSGSLTASGDINGINVQSNSGDATLTIQSADVTLTSNSGNGVTVQAGSTNSSGEHTITLSVEGGSLTASGSTGISFDSASSNTVSATNLTVSNNAIVRANDVGSNISDVELAIGADNSSSGGIVFDGNAGTVYGSVILQEDLTIGEDERLTIGKDASLTVPSGTTLTNNGTVTTTDGGSLTNQGTINNSGTLPDSIEGSQPPKITTASLPNGEVGTAYSQTLAATGNDTITWSVSGTLPDGLSLNNDGTISGTPTAAGASTFTVTATNDSGSDSKQLTLTVTQPVTGVTLDQAELALYTGGSATLSATVTPENATNTSLTWASDAENIATVDQSGNVKAVGAGTATITATAADGSGKSATCTVTVTDKTYKISADATVLNFGSAYTGYTQPAAQTVTLTNTGNQTVTLTQPASTNRFEVGTLSTTNLAAGETATFTVQPKAGLAAGTYSDTIAVTGNGGATLSITASFTVKSQPPTIPPTVSEKTIDAIQDAEPGETVTVDLSSGSTKLDKDVFETLAGQDITLDIDLGDGLSWTVNGTDIPEDADFVDIDLGVTMDTSGIPVDVVNAITGERDSVQITLAHDGAFGFTMTLTAPLGTENAGLWANLYHFDEDAGAMTFETAAPIGSDGSVSLPLSHASQYAIVIDNHNHGVIELPFTDVADSDWFYDPVCFVYSQGLMTGTSATTFEPNISLSRAMLVAVLHRLEGSPAASAGDFTDVADGDWYAQAVNWAASVGVVNGFDDGTFQPNTAITREQLAAILMNYAQYKGQDVSARATLDTYNDATAISSWANDVMSWAVAEGLLTGVTNDQLQPQGNATRAQVAAILERFLDN